MPRFRCYLLAFAAASLSVIGPAHAEDGYDLWLRYRPVEAQWLAQDAPFAREIVGPSASGTQAATMAELDRGLGGLLGAAPAHAAAVDRDGAILVGTPASSPAIRALNLPLAPQGSEGYLVRSATVNGHRATVIAANSDTGALYGAFRFLRLIQTRQPLGQLAIADAPKVKFRMLDHWDNLDRWRERGYSGASIFDWWTLPQYRNPRYTDYARADASIGINGVVVNNVNASADILSARYIAKAAALAAMLRPYGIRLYLSVNFASPLKLGGLKTADPLDPAVAAWWESKANEIYRAIPDFGGFLVKASSEGQPGPGDYHRSHADGANMMAAALGPHGGIVIWRAFVYSAGGSEDRVKQAYDEFKPLDGTFAKNVLIQVKNGPLDFQPREPFSPLFGAMPKTPLAMEVEITKEYLGQATSLVYLGPMWEETFRADTMVQGAGSTVAKVVDGSLDHHGLSAVAGVANVGSDGDWTGSPFNGANWYAFGRLAWDPEASARDIAADWAAMTFTPDPRFVTPVVAMMMGSREAAVDYMTPLGLAHQMGTGHHYGPGPWIHDLARPEWNPVYYNRADEGGIGVDRTATGSDAIAQYASPVAKTFGDLSLVPDRDLLWFHHLPWTYKMRDGGTLWSSLAQHYSAGVRAVGAMQATWKDMRPYVDAERWAHQAQFLDIQLDEAHWWRDASIAYWQSLNHLPLPAGEAAPAHDLAWYQALSFPHAPGQEEPEALRNGK